MLNVDCGWRWMEDGGPTENRYLSIYHVVDDRSKYLDALGDLRRC